MLGQRQPLLLPPGSTIVPIGQDVPSGWNGGFGRDGFAGFAVGGNGQTIAPGMTANGFVLTSPRVPTIREFQALADWVLIVPDHDEITDDVLDEAGRVEERITFSVYSLGPASLADVGSHRHWDMLRADLGRIIELGWCSGAEFMQDLDRRLAEARIALDAEDGTLAKTRLAVLQGLLGGVTQATCRREALDLLTLNIASLIANTPDTPIPVQPEFTLTPQQTSRAVGETHVVRARVVNAADANRPLSGFHLRIDVVEGPHAGQGGSGRTNADGELEFEYIGTRTGTDRIVLGELLSLNSSPIMVASMGDLEGLVPPALGLAEAIVTWEGGVDLAIPFFMPPMVKSMGGNTIYLSDVAINAGSLPAPKSLIRYYLSATLPIDPDSAHVIGEREVPELQVDEENHASEQPFELPAGLPDGLYYLAACADPDNSVVELNEDNNCSYNQLDTHVSSVVSVERITSVSPDCSMAKPSETLLWPPNHKMVKVRIDGVTHSEGSPTGIEITSVRQDEPVNGLGDGDTAPDASGIGTPQVNLRAERAGTGNGRVYIVGFTATSADGGSCTGTVTVGVPHDRSGKIPPIDDGLRYDSTLDSAAHSPKAK